MKEQWSGNVGFAGIAISDFINKTSKLICII
jgi:hypothetical protein